MTLEPQIENRKKLKIQFVLMERAGRSEGCEMFVKNFHLTKAPAHFALSHTHTHLYTAKALGESSGKRWKAEMQKDM